MLNLNQPELAYFLGLCVSRGHFSDSKMTVSFNYKTKKIQLPPGLHADLSKKGREYTIDGTKITQLLKEYLQTEIETHQDDQKYSMIVTIPQGSFVFQTLSNILGSLDCFHYKTACIPNSIWKSSTDIQKCFIRGIADSCSSPTYGDRDAKGYTRICMDIPFENWKLPINICRLLQENLKIPVTNILWGHPNLRASQNPTSHSWAKEHRVRLFSTEFQKVDFGFEFKKEILKKFIEHDGSRRPQTFCWPNKQSRYTQKMKHNDENSNKIPIEARKHVCHFREVCSSIGCVQKKNERI